MMNWDMILTSLAVILVITVIVVLIRKKTPTDGGYDERQMTLRAEGYRRGFFGTLIAAGLAILLLEFGVIPAASASLAVFTALMIGLVVFAVFCIMKDVFFRIGEVSKRRIVLYAVIVLLDGGAAVSRIADGSLLENGVPTFASCNSIVMALSFIVILAAILIRRAAGEEDDE